MNTDYDVIPKYEIISTFIPSICSLRTLKIWLTVEASCKMYRKYRFSLKMEVNNLSIKMALLLPITTTSRY